MNLSLVKSAKRNVKEQDRNSDPLKLLLKEDKETKQTRFIDFKYEHGNASGVYGYHDDEANEGGINGSKTGPWASIDFYRDEVDEGGINSNKTSPLLASTEFNDQKSKNKSSQTEYYAVYFFLHKMMYNQY